MEQQRRSVKILARVQQQVQQDELELHLIPDADPISRCSEPALLAELERGLNQHAVKEYLALQTRMGVGIGYFVGSLFAIGGALGVFRGLAGAPLNAVSPVSGVWFPAVSCILGVLAIIDANKLKRMRKL
jgi:hypothetical protein